MRLIKATLEKALATTDVVNYYLAEVADGQTVAQALGDRLLATDSEAGRLAKAIAKYRLNHLAASAKIGTQATEAICQFAVTAGQTSCPNTDCGLESRSKLISPLAKTEQSATVSFVCGQEGCPELGLGLADRLVDLELEEAKVYMTIGQQELLEARARLAKQ